MARYSNNPRKMRSGVIISMLTLFALVILSHVVSAFVTPIGKSQSSSMMVKTQQCKTSNMQSLPTTTTTLHERQWNFNEGQGPFGLKRNAETWNGRVAQMGFILVFLQELIFGKGVVQGLTEGDPIYIACAVAFFATTLGLTVFLAIKGPDNYVDDELKRK